MHNSRVYMETGIVFQLICSGEAENVVITLLKVSEAFQDLLFRGFRIKTEKGEGELSSMVIQLG